MSLYVGHLSPHVRPEELERVFRRFGQCNLQMKDGYGFIIYEATANAERALRELRGKMICGEQLSLNWSNRQPRPIQISGRRSRFFEPYHGRNFRREDNGFEFRDSQDRKDFAGISRNPIHNREGHRSDNVPDKEVGHAYEDVDELGRGKGVGFKERVIDEGGPSELDPVEADRWGEPASDALTGHGQEIDSGFDRYEPYHGYNRRDERENNHMGSFYNSRDRGSSLEKGQREHSFDKAKGNFDRIKPQEPCYNCGLVGHIVRNCPHGNSRQEKFSKFNHMRDEISFRYKDREREKRLGPNSWGRPNSSRDRLISRHHTRDRVEHHFEKPRRVRRSDLESNKTIWSKSREDSQATKKRKLENGTPKKGLKKRKTRRSGASSSSDSSTTSAQSSSKSLRSTSGTSSRSHSKSKSSRSHSASSGSRSTSASSHSNPPTSRSMSKSRLRSSSTSSFLRSPSLSVSLDQKPLPSAKGNLEHVPSHLEISDLIGTCSTLKDDEANGKHPVIDTHNNIDVTSENPGGIDVTSENPGGIDVTSENQGEETEFQGSTRISTQEMLSALRHYGLVTLEGAKSSTSLEAYFGAARMRPWEMIYYRRLRKGPISTENYARRLEQNRKFGIVDKYIRSSSGWGECHQNDS